MKRLLCIVDSLNAGGAETFLMKIYRCIDKTQYQMDFIVSESGIYDEEVKNLGGVIHTIPMRTKHPLKSLNSIKTIVAENAYSNVLKLGSTPIAVLDILAAKLGGAKKLAVRSCNAFANEGNIYKIANIILRPVFNRMVTTKVAPSDLAAIFTFGKSSYDKGEVFMLHNAVDTDYFKYDDNARHSIRKELSLEDKLVIGHVGRFEPQKNHLFLLEIFKCICDKNQDVRLLLVGKGVLEDSLREKAKQLGVLEKIVFTGVRSDIPALLSAMDTFVFPSFYEGMPNTVIEAQATGLPCIIADTITKEANITGLVNYLSLNDSPELWAEKAIAASRMSRKDTKQDFVDNKYDIESSVKEFVRLIF